MVQQKIKNALLRVICFSDGEKVMQQRSSIVCGNCKSAWVYFLIKGQSVMCRDCGKVSKVTTKLERAME